ncbi:hypothetical protein BGX38DRAFT_1147172 [Terfezia claveryi]|nr:hypothetical protein BGX38DRAFT_1147172 [Terfezia claveryi]
MATTKTKLKNIKMMGGQQRKPKNIKTMGGQKLMPKKTKVPLAQAVPKRRKVAPIPKIQAIWVQKKRMKRKGDVQMWTELGLWPPMPYKWLQKYTYMSFIQIISHMSQVKFCWGVFKMDYGSAINLLATQSGNTNPLRQTILEKDVTLWRQVEANHLCGGNMPINPAG